MDANAVPFLQVFEKKMRLDIPLFQRQYVWNEEQQWEPLWEDTARKFTEYLEGREDAPVHFLGAMVLDLKHTPTTHVEKRQVIDGQQRLTTLQLFLSAYRDFCYENDCGDLADECDIYRFNKGMMADPEVDVFKVWPTRLDQKQFIDVSVEPFHLFRYLDEHVFRFNNRKESDLKRFLRTASAIIDKRLTYAALTGAELSPR